MKTKVVTFGELLLRFSKLDHQRLSQGDYFTSKYGGSEANVAVSLATLGDNVQYVTRLPNTPVGHAGAQNLMQLGVDCRYIQWGGQRIGTYYMEPAAGMRSAKVIYDRANSACSEIEPGMIPWREILKASRLPSHRVRQMPPSKHSTLPMRWASRLPSTSTTVRTCGSMAQTRARR